MAKRATHLIAHIKSKHSHKTKKRLAIKKLMLKNLLKRRWHNENTINRTINCTPDYGNRG